MTETDSQAYHRLLKQLSDMGGELHSRALATGRELVTPYVVMPDGVRIWFRHRKRVRVYFGPRNSSLHAATCLGIEVTELSGRRLWELVNERLNR